MSVSLLGLGLTCILQHCSSALKLVVNTANSYIKKWVSESQSF